MSFNRLNNDTCQYQQTLAESIGPGHYQLNTPPISCEPCYPNDVQVRLQHSGDSLDTSQPMLDIDSELLNITRPSSKCPSRKYLPECPGYTADGYPCGQGVVPTCKPNSGKATHTGHTGHTKGAGPNRCPGAFGSYPTNWKDCGMSVDDTRLSNPPCNLRGTGINRWEWLCLNPQDRVEMPFDYNVSNRIVVKDNHRPCVPTPLDQQNLLPRGGELPCEPVVNSCANPTEPPSVNWQQCGVIGHY